MRRLKRKTEPRQQILNLDHQKLSSTEMRKNLCEEMIININCNSDLSYSDALHKKMKFSIKDFSSKSDHLVRSADLVTFTGEILNGKLHFLCSDASSAVVKATSTMLSKRGKAQPSWFLVEESCLLPLIEARNEAMRNVFN